MEGSLLSLQAERCWTEIALKSGRGEDCTYAPHCSFRLMWLSSRYRRSECTPYTDCHFYVSAASASCPQAAQSIIPLRQFADSQRVLDKSSPTFWWTLHCSFQRPSSYISATIQNHPQHPFSRKGRETATSIFLACHTHKTHLTRPCPSLVRAPALVRLSYRRV